MTKRCSVENCDRPFKCKSLCKMHYKRLLRNGHLELLSQSSAGRGASSPLVDRFWEQVEKTEECWIWQGPKDTGGYGQIGHKGKTLRAHRVAFELCGGTLIEGLVIDHLCRVKHCVNPAHMEQVTQEENVARAPHPGPAGQRWTKNGLGPHELAPCGTAGAYKRGCRCDDCRGWQNGRMAEYRRRQAA